MPGPPPIPAEVKRRRGNPGKRPLPDPVTVVALPMVEGVPEPPGELGQFGVAMWRAVWEAGRWWVSGTEAMLEAFWLCQAADERERLRQLVLLGGDEKYRRAQRELEKQMTQWVQDLGFSPVARTRMGVAEVKAQTAMETLREKRAAK